MAAINLGIIGFGIMGERLLRAALDHAAAHVRPAGVWDPSPAAAARLAEVAPGVAMLDGTAVPEAGTLPTPVTSSDTVPPALTAAFGAPVPNLVSSTRDGPTDRCCSTVSVRRFDRLRLADRDGQQR